MLFFPLTQRDDVVDLVDCYQYEDNQVNDADAFAREPYILHFKSHNTGQFLRIIQFYFLSMSMLSCLWVSLVCMSHAYI